MPTRRIAWLLVGLLGCSSSSAGTGSSPQGTGDGSTGDAQGDGSGADAEMDAGSGGDAHDATGDGIGIVLPDGSGTTDATTDDSSIMTDGGPHAPFPSVTVHGSGVMTGIKLVSVVASNDTNGSTLLSFGDALVASQWWKTVSAPYGNGPFASHTKLTGASLTGNVTVDQIQTFITSTLTAQGQPAPDASTLYVLYLPQNVWVVDPTTNQPNTDCSFYEGFHYYDMSNTNFVWAIAQQCPMGGGIPGLTTPLQAATHVASHEILEAATDVHGTDGWSLDCSNESPPNCTPWLYVPAYPGEIGDLCAWTVTNEAGFVFTRAWANTAAAAGGDPCVPAVTATYVSAGTTQSWYTIAAGQTLQVPVTGWAQSAAPAWQVYSYVGYDPKNEFTVTPNAFVKLGVGATTTFTVSAPTTAASGDFVVVDVASYTATEIHPWAVGFYVP
jgi:hypothetical protein